MGRPIQTVHFRKDVPSFVFLQAGRAISLVSSIATSVILCAFRNLYQDYLCAPCITHSSQTPRFSIVAQRE